MATGVNGVAIVNAVQPVGFKLSTHALEYATIQHQWTEVLDAEGMQRRRTPVMIFPDAQVRMKA